MKYTSICKKDCREGRYKKGEKYEVNEFYWDDGEGIRFIEPERKGYSIFIWEYEKFFHTHEEMLNINRTELIDEMLK